MRRSVEALAATVIAVSLASAPAMAADPNEANNPLTPKITINFQDYYAASFHDLPGKPDANSFLFRGLIPSKLGGLPQLFRFTLPVNTVPSFSRTLPPRFDGRDTGVGDLTLIDLFVLPTKGIEVAAGPLLVAPTASQTAPSAEQLAAIKDSASPARRPISTIAHETV